MADLANYQHKLEELNALRIAIVHEWFDSYAGSERVVEQLISLFPKADVFALVDFFPPSKRAILGNKTVKTSFIQRLPWARSGFRNYFPLFPLAVESHDLSAYDLVISSSHMVAKGVLVNQNQLHVSYCHSPCRYAWDLYHQYLREAGLKRGIKGFLAQYFLHRLRVWDQISTPRVHHFVANSGYIGKRISHVYGRKAQVVYPPVDTERFIPAGARGDYFFAASRLVPYKRMDVIVEAFRQRPNLKLIIVGSGPDEQNLRRRLSPNIEFRSEADASEFLKLMQDCRAFVFAAEEDFGITMAEAQAAGVPVIAYRRGGANEIVEDGKTGLLFAQQTPESLIETLDRFEETSTQFDRNYIRQSAQRFSIEAFRMGMVDQLFEQWRQRAF